MCLLKEAAAALPHNMLAAAAAAKRKFSAENKSFILKAAVNTGMEPVVAAVLAAFPAAWTERALASSLGTAANRDGPGIFKLLVNEAVSTATAAAAVTEEDGSAAIEAATAGKTPPAADLAALQAALLYASRANKGELVRWVLQQGQGRWSPGAIESVIWSAIEGSSPASLEALLAGCGITWSSQQLMEYLMEAVEKPAPDRANQQTAACVGVLLAAAAQSGHKWTKQELTRALRAAVHCDAASTIILIVEQPGVEWRGQDLRDTLAEQIRLAGSTSGNDVVIRLVRAAAGEWRRGQLVPLLTEAAAREWGAAMEALVQESGTDWYSSELLPAMECLAGSCHEFQELYLHLEPGNLEPGPGNSLLNERWCGSHSEPCNHARVMEVLLGEAKDGWTEQQLTELLLLAVEHKRRKVVGVLLRELGGGCSSEQLWPAVQLALDDGEYGRASRVQPILVDLVKAAQGDWSEEQLSALLDHAEEKRWWVALQGLVGVEGVQLTAEGVQNLVAAAGEVYIPQDRLLTCSDSNSSEGFWRSIKLAEEAEAALRAPIAESAEPEQQQEGTWCRLREQLVTAGSTVAWDEHALEEAVLYRSRR